MKKFLCVLLAALLMLAVFAGCGNKDANGGDNGADSGDTIKIGVLAPLTGNVSVYGQAAANGIKLGVDEINADGGVLGKQIELIVLDEKGDPNEAMTAYNNLVSQGIVALIGDVTTKPCIAVAELAAEDNMPMITPTGTGAEITETGPNVFRTCFIDPNQGAALANFANESLGAKTAALLVNNSDDYSTGVAAKFEEVCKDNGIKVIANEGYGADDKDFRAQLTKINELNPDVICLPDYYNTVALVTDQAREVGYDGVFLGADGWDGVLEVMDEAKISALNDCYFSNHYFVDSDDVIIKSFVEAFRAEYNETPNAFAALGYDSAYIVKAAIEKAGSTDADAIIEALAATDLQCVTGNIKFDDHNNPIKEATIIKFVDGVATYETTVSYAG